MTRPKQGKIIPKGPSAHIPGHQPPGGIPGPASPLRENIIPKNPRPIKNITPIISRKTADFVGWCDPVSAWNKVAGGIWLLTTGAHTEVWDTFDPLVSPMPAYRAGCRGSDQSWMSYMLYPPEQYWTRRDGIYKMGWLRKAGHRPPPEVKMIFTIGTKPPWSEAIQLGAPWIKDHWY